MTSWLLLNKKMTKGRKRSGSPRVAPADLPAETAMDSLINETVLLFHRLKIVADEVHHQGEMSGGLRSILRSLDKFGAQTVPQMARARSVSRQHIQILVNELVEKELVEFISNPAHKRSPFVQLTRHGKKTVDEMNQREKKLMGKADLDVADKKLHEAAETLRIVRELFESEQWKRLVKKKVER